MTGTMRIATRDMAPRDRIGFMRDFYGAKIMGVDLSPVGEAGFDMRIQARALDGVGLGGFGVTSGIVADRPRRMTADGNARMMIATYGTPFLTTTGKGPDIEISAGDACVLPLDVPVRWVMPERSAMVSVMVDPEALRSRLPRFDPGGPLCLPAQTPGLRLMFGHMTGIVRAGLTDESETTETAQQVLDLAAFALGNVRHPDEVGATGGLRAARVAAILDDLRRSFREPGLNTAQVAARHGISPRYLQRLLDEAGTGFVATVQTLRLDHAAGLLATSPAQVRIAAIAADAGFTDMSTFTRLFRHRFGDSPSGWRATARTADSRG